MTALEKAQEHGSRPNLIVMNEHKYSALRHKNDGILTICGMEVKFADLPDNFEFYITERIRY